MFHLFQINGFAQFLRHGSDCFAGVPTRDDHVECLNIGVNIQGDAVVSHPTPYGNSDTCYFAGTDPYAGSPFMEYGFEAIASKDSCDCVK